MYWLARPGATGDAGRPSSARLTGAVSADLCTRSEPIQLCWMRSPFGDPENPGVKQEGCEVDASRTDFQESPKWLSAPDSLTRMRTRGRSSYYGAQQNRGVHAL